MTPDYIQISVTPDVYEYLKGKSTFEDDPSSVLRRELKLPAVAVEQDNGVEADHVPAGSPQIDAAFHLRQRPSARKSKSVKRKRARAAAGTLLPESAYHRPILEVLSDNGGSAPKQVVIDEVGKRLKDRLTEADRDELESGGIRWQSRAQFARLRLADKGFIDKKAPRGVWAITSDATTALEEGTV